MNYNTTLANKNMVCQRNWQFDEDGNKNVIFK